MEDIILLIKVGEELPEVNKAFSFTSVLSQENRTYHIKKITSLRWNKYGDLVISCKGSLK